MQPRTVIGLAGAGALALGVVALVVASRRDGGSGNSGAGGLPGATPTTAARTGTNIDFMVGDYFSRYDHDSSSLIDLRPREYDARIQQPDGVSVAQASTFARTDERVTSYVGDLAGDGLTLQALSAIELFMQAAQRHPAPGAAAQQATLATLELTPGQLRAEIARFDRDRDGYLASDERIAFDSRYPEIVMNFRWIRVLHLGEWQAANG